jgi:hypothetical protein
LVVSRTKGAGAEPLAKKLDRNLRGYFVDCLLNFFGGLGKPVCVHIDSDAATRTGHMLVRLEPPDRLFELVSTPWTLESDFVSIGLDYRERASCQRSAI